MGKEIIWDKVVWNDGDDFVAFAFGDFESKMGGIIRTSNGNRYDSALSAPIGDITADVPGRDGSYYFGSTHKPKQFNVSFAFDNLSTRQLRNLKKAFNGKELKELCFAEEPNRIYMAKVTGQPNIKALCFDDGGEEIYKGEGNVQFTAYWPYARDFSESEYFSDATQDETTTTIYVENEGDIPAYFTFTSTIGVSKIDIDEINEEDLPTDKTYIEGNNIDYWDSKTGIVKSQENTINYTGDGLLLLPIGLSKIVITHGKQDTTIKNAFQIKFYNWYY